MALCFGLAAWSLAPAAVAQTIRIVAYNIEADTGGYTAPRPGLTTVLEAIGEESVQGNAQPLDLLALEETTSNTATVAPLVAALNGYYGAGTYAYVPFQATTYNGNPSSGNGPNALVYNTRTLSLVYQNGAPAVAVAGTAAKSGGVTVNRQVPRYEFQPVGAAAGAAFYVYVSHMKSGDAGTGVNAADRLAEAQAIRADAATLPANANLLYMGDFNMDGSAEAAYQTLTAPGTAAGQGFDPLNFPQDNGVTWGSATPGLLTESATSLRYRDDIQFMSANVFHSATAGLRYVAGSQHAFGNNGTTGYGKSVNGSANTALAALAGPVTASQTLSALTTASDHLPVVADYVVVTNYAAWRAARFTAAELADPAVSGDLADPDGDGLTNLLEYAFNLDPRRPGTAGVPAAGTTVLADGGPYLTLTYTRVLAGTDITYVPQVSGDLVNWSAGTAVVSTTNNDDGLTQTVVVRDLVPAGDGARRFMRLAITRP